MLETRLFFPPSRTILETGQTNRAVEQLTNFLRLILFLSVFVVAVHAQQPSSEEDEELIKPTRPGIANPAEFQRPGVLQIEYGYDGNFPGDQFRSQQAAPLTFRFAPVERVLLDFNFDTVISEKNKMRMRQTGVGDTRAGVQFLALKDTEQRPGLAFAFYAKLPTGSSEKHLGTGRADYRVVVLVSKKIGKTDFDFNTAYLNVGREFGGNRASGGQAAFSVAREFENSFGIVGELAGQSEDDVQPKGIFALGAMTHKVSKRLQFVPECDLASTLKRRGSEFTPDSQSA
ncbi:hypothetical protein BH20ACI3_BH20ACI3_11110 [soil metagenome]